MASPEHSTENCAFCGVGELPTCRTCASNVAGSPELQLVQDAELQQQVLMVPMRSDNIRLAGWRHRAGGVGVLLLQFVTAATIFRYDNVTHDWWLQFLQAESKGSFFHRTVRADQRAHPFRKL